MKNEISIDLPEEDFNSILQGIDGIDNSLPFLINQPEEKRQGGFKLGDKNLGFLEKIKDYLVQSPDFLPGYYSNDEVQRDARLTGQLTFIARRLRVLADKIEDTASIAGVEALAGALAYYNGVKHAAKSNVNGAQTIYDDLKTRFPGRPAVNNNNNE